MKVKNRISVLALILVCALLLGCTPIVNEEMTTTTAGTTTTITEAMATTTAVNTMGKEEATAKTKQSTTVTRTTRPTLTTRTLTLHTTVTPHPQYTGGVIWDPGELKDGTTPLEQGLAFGGRTFTYAYCGTALDDEQQAQVADFEKTYHAELDIRRIPADEYVAALAAAMAAGDPYGIIQLCGENYPSQIIANVTGPLNDYITTADLWDPSAPEKGGFSWSLMKTLSLNGHIYGAGGVYAMSPTVLFYNKDLFAAAGYTDSEDPLSLDNAGQWTWEKLYEMLRAVQKPDNGLWGIHSIAVRGARQLIASYDTDLVKGSDGAGYVQNLADPHLYAAMQTLQTYCYGDRKVADPDSRSESVYEDFLNGRIASVIGSAEEYERFSSQKKINVGIVPVPGAEDVTSVWEWRAYGVGNGASREDIRCALAFAKYNAQNVPAYYMAMETTARKTLCRAMESDRLRAPMTGFYSSAGTLRDTANEIIGRIGVKGENITVTLKAYEKATKTLIDAAVKS